jgi:glycosyltransferase involved in cell wall biosynthesis
MAKLAIYGEGELKHQMVLAIKKAGLKDSIQLYPTSHHIAKELKKTKFLLLLSKYEGMPLIGLEAMRYGCVILGKNVPGIQDLVVDGVYRRYSAHTVHKLTEL